jgi:hypothetical protein
MEETRSEAREREGKGSWHRQVNWWGIFGLLCGIGSGYLTLRILIEAIALLAKGP